MGDELIPKLRKDIEIKILDTSYVEETYLIKAGERQYEISAKYAQLLKLIDGKRSIEDITTEFSKVINRPVSSADIKNMIDNDLILTGIVSFGDSFTEAPKKRTYLHFRFPLIKENKLYPVANLFHQLFDIKIMIVLISFVTITQLYFYLFLDAPLTSVVLISGTDLSLATLLVFVSLLFHELGHISACHHYGAKYQNVGVGLYFYFPAFYSDVTGAWVLNRRQRTVVDFGGVYFQLLMVPLFIALYQITHEGYLVYVVYIINFSILSNLNPFIRLDGYWMASDLTGIPNLRKKSIEIIKYYIRKLYKTNIKQPLFLNQIKEKILIGILIYSILSTAFYIFFGFKIFSEFTFAILSYGTIAQRLIHSVSVGVNEFISSFIKFMFVNIVLFSFLFFLYRLILSKLLKLLTDNLKTKLSFPKSWK